MSTGSVLGVARSLSGLLGVMLATTGSGCAGSQTSSSSQTLPTVGGAVVAVSGVSFERAPGQVAADCRTAAREIRYVVVCPRVLPSGWISSFFKPMPGNTERELFVKTQRHGRLARWTFLSVQDPTATVPSHLVMSSAPMVVTPWEFVCACSPSSRLPALPHLYWADLKQTARTRIDGQRARIIKVLAADSIFENHTILLWTSAGRTYGIGFHGLGRRALTLDRTLAEHLQLVSP